MNAWLDVYDGRIRKLIHDLEDYRLKGSYGGDLNLTEVISVIKGACVEINKLDKQVKELEAKIKDLELTVSRVLNEDIMEG